MDQTKVALIWPWGLEPDRVYPLAIAYLAANIDREKFDLRVFDNAIKDRRSESEEFQADLVEFQPDVIGISGWITNREEMAALVKVIRTILPKSIVVIGGVYATGAPAQAFKVVAPDYLIVGEAEKSFNIFLSEISKDHNDLSIVPGLWHRDPTDDDKVLKNEVEYPDVDMDSIAIPDYDAVDIDEYLQNGYRYKTPAVRNAPIWVTRGCPYRCTFCAAPTINGKPVRTHSPEYITEHVKYLYEEKGIEWFNIIDDNFTLRKSYAKNVCRALIDLNLPVKFGTPNGIRLQKGDVELWSLMKQAGWEFLVIAPESGSQNTLNIMKKDLDLNIVPPIIDDIHSAGLSVQAFFIVGYPGETYADLQLTKDFVMKSKIDFPVLNFFQALPGTPVYDELVANGEIDSGASVFNIQHGKPSYQNPNLKDVNLTRFVQQTYIELILKRPRVLFYALRYFPLKLVVRTLFLQTLNSFASKWYQKRIS